MTATNTKRSDHAALRDELFEGAMEIVDGILSDEMDGQSAENVVIIALQKLQALQKQMEYSLTIRMN